MFSVSLKKNDESVAYAGKDINSATQYIQLHKDKVADQNTLKGTHFHIVPNLQNRQIIYVAGASGSGKSYFTAHFIKDFLALDKNKSRKVYIFSRLAEDKVFDDIIKAEEKRVASSKKSEDEVPPVRVHRVTIDQTLITDPIDIQEEVEKGSLLVFDDIDTITGKIGKAVYALIDDVLQCGRHFNLSMIITSHLINGNNRNFSRMVHNESHFTVLFPYGLSRKHIDYYSNTYLGISKAQIAMFYKLGRSVVISKHYPQYVLSETQISPLQIADS